MATNINPIVSPPDDINVSVNYETVNAEVTFPDEKIVNVVISNGIEVMIDGYYGMFPSVWGDIGGTISRQTDLMDELDLKANQSDLNTTNQNLSNHTSNINNPHSVTKTQIGLSNVPNIDTTNAGNISSGTIDGDRLPGISSDKKGAVPATGIPSGKFLKDDGTWYAIPVDTDVWGNITGDILTQTDLQSQFGTKVNDTGDTITGQLFIDGSLNEVQLKVQGYSSQTNNLQEWQNSSGSVLASVDKDGKITSPTITDVQAQLTQLNLNSIAMSIALGG